MYGCALDSQRGKRQKDIIGVDQKALINSCQWIDRPKGCILWQQATGVAYDIAATIGTYFHFPGSSCAEAQTLRGLLIGDPGTADDSEHA